MYGYVLHWHTRLIHTAIQNSTSSSTEAAAIVEKLAKSWRFCVRFTGRSYQWAPEEIVFSGHFRRFRGHLEVYFTQSQWKRQCMFHLCYFLLHCPDHDPGGSKDLRAFETDNEESIQKNARVTSLFHARRFLMMIPFRECAASWKFVAVSKIIVFLHYGEWWTTLGPTLQWFAHGPIMELSPAFLNVNKTSCCL
jgi:hypothetical protein